MQILPNQGVLFLLVRWCWGKWQRNHCCRSRFCGMGDGTAVADFYHGAEYCDIIYFFGGGSLETGTFSAWGNEMWWGLWQHYAWIHAQTCPMTKWHAIIIFWETILKNGIGCARVHLGVLRCMVGCFRACHTQVSEHIWVHWGALGCTQMCSGVNIQVLGCTWGHFCMAQVHGGCLAGQTEVFLCSKKY